MAGTRQHYNGNDLEIDSELATIQFCIKNGSLLIYSEDEQGDVSPAHVRLCDIKKLAKELKEIYEVYFKDTKCMKWR